MGNLRQVVVLWVLVVLIDGTTPLPSSANQILPVRTTRTLGSLFGSKPAHPSPPPIPPQLAPAAKVQQQSHGPQQVVRPLVYQVKYYDRGQQPPNTLVDYFTPQDPRNYGNIDKAGVGVDNPHQQVVSFGNPSYVAFTSPAHQPQYSPFQVPVPTTPPRFFYYNPLIPPDPTPQPSTPFYTIATIGNTQVLVPCTTSPVVDPFVYDSTVTLNVDQPGVVAQPTTVNHQQQQQQQPNHKVVVQRPVASGVPEPVPPIPQTAPQRSPVNVPPHVQQMQQQASVVVPQQPLVREQVVAAAAELSTYGSFPGSGVVGAGLNSVPYGYYYYYYIPPPTPPPHQQQQIHQSQVVVDAVHTQPGVQGVPHPYVVQQSPVMTNRGQVYRVTPQQHPHYNYSPYVPVVLSAGSGNQQVPGMQAPFTIQNVVVPQPTNVIAQQVVPGVHGQGSSQPQAQVKTNGSPVPQQQQRVNTKEAGHH